MYSLLKDVRVLEASRLIPGAYAASRLADLGADVIKVESPPHGDYLRSIPPLMDGLSLYHIALNRGKRSVLIDTKTEAGRETLTRLVKSADIFIEGSRPGAMAAQGMDYDSLKKLKPDLIYCSLSAYGQNGPYKTLPAHGANMECAAGAVSVETTSDGRPFIPSIRAFTASQGGAIHAALAISAALFHRERTGEGSYLDVSGWDAAVSWQYKDLISLLNLGEELVGSFDKGGRYRPFACADGKWVMFAAIEPKFWRRFCEAAGRPDLSDKVAAESLVDFGEDDADDGVGLELENIMVGKTQAEWIRLAVEYDIPVTPVVEIEDMPDNEHARARGTFLEVPHPETGAPTRLIAPPFRVGGETFEVTRPAPKLGEHNDEILAELDLMSIKRP
jgi:crotonobetainyl-CoA:carnitine CoA-transferase CaiB-like acyl-CoA transferase